MCARARMRARTRAAAVVCAGRTCLCIRGSCTFTMPMLDLLVLKANSVISAFVFDTQLNIVVLPVLVSPIIPQFKAINDRCSKIGRKNTLFFLKVDS